MIILLNTHSNALNVQYKVGNKAFRKQLPSRVLVGMKGLSSINQLTNRGSLTNSDVTIYHYESNTVFNGTNPTASTLSFMFIGDNVKKGNAFTAPTAISGFTMMQGMI